ncbi:hypothetical protein HMPREF2531_05283 [Bacteroides intestinalis]|uniref:Uncharacterized protein n=1 Tax=Bacteroides intestinalis TaxID=329854 RepID=A0A139KMT0_9BACE|nr:hypothetical protein HMPREF2531_05283 [Bacteroides intestinalis]
MEKTAVSFVYEFAYNINCSKSMDIKKAQFRIERLPDATG